MRIQPEICINEVMETAIATAYRAGLEILKVYDTPFDVEQKEDTSPLTLADRNAHEEIAAGLSQTQIPILSEEGRKIPFAERKEWTRFWMVDPLDGTKEFVKRNGEFTVNIALIENGISVAGVIYVPVTGVMYFGIPEKGAFKISKFNNQGAGLEKWIASAKKLPSSNQSRVYTVVGSRSHKSLETADFMDELSAEHGEINIVSMGSSLKICLVAEGVADIYPRFAPTMEWDTAAGHAIAKGAGKEIYDHSTGKPMVYNKENLLNNWFIVK
ncbi:3'(2'),5'-bisphosphate nucleotidase CysQ [Cryomorpha ignava]|uniref:3'(2'),5'-bisphosphate nucleotidase CysQ n=1 Tax=Cryomorpha ignava TaxID=101383 RepID=A0A7K3WMB6_9FLAO|nr:3'(2'),5'-bisphosphate nucleotidase CysQ [Cryomorpha ignava]NEN22032.1 3'(2'),5'-bisphosphate nucleotidase CysQ [Cryomorpha ignava]